MSSADKSVRYQGWVVACLLAVCLICLPAVGRCNCEGSSASHSGVVKGSSAEKPADHGKRKAQASDLGKADAKKVNVQKEGGASDASEAKAETKPFSMDELIARLKKTDAIGFLTKLTLRSDAIDLIDMVKAYKQHASRYSLADLHAKFNGLLLKVLALLSDDPKLSKDISAARDDIWKSLMEVKA